MNSYVKYQLIIILVVLSKLYSSETVVCPIKCTLFCECFKNLNGSFVCGNWKFDEMDLSDKDNDAQKPSHTLMTPSVPTSVPNPPKQECKFCVVNQWKIELVKW